MIINDPYHAKFTLKDLGITPIGKKHKTESVLHWKLKNMLADYFIKHGYKNVQTEFTDINGVRYDVYAERDGKKYVGEIGNINEDIFLERLEKASKTVDYLCWIPFGLRNLEHYLDEFLSVPICGKTTVKFGNKELTFDTNVHSITTFTTGHIIKCFDLDCIFNDLIRLKKHDFMIRYYSKKWNLSTLVTQQVDTT